MSADEYIPSKPLSVGIPKGSSSHGPYCPRRPTLREILSNTSSPPWTLAAFMAYLSSNHCLETLEFTMDAGRYKKHYAKMLSRAGTNGTPPSKDREYVWQLWQRLIDAYIQPNGSREVNLPSLVRDPILNLPQTPMPPTPETLDPAVAKIYELMEESVLGPFLNSVYPQTAHPTVSSCPLSTSDEKLPLSSSKADKSGVKTHRRAARSSPPPQSAVEPHAHSYSHSTFTRGKSAPSGIAQGLQNSKPASRNNKLSATSSAPAQTRSIGPATSGSDANLSGPGMTDDTGSVSSPSGDSPLTPPFSPPPDELSPMSASPRSSRDSGMWKKLGRLSSMKVGRKKSSGGLNEQ